MCWRKGKCFFEKWAKTQKRKDKRNCVREVIHKLVYPLIMKSQSSAEVYPPSTFPKECVVLAAILNVFSLTSSPRFTFFLSHFHRLLQGNCRMNEKHRWFDRWSFFMLAQVHERISVLQSFFSPMYCKFYFQNVLMLEMDHTWTSVVVLLYSTRPQSVRDRRAETFSPGRPKLKPNGAPMAKSKHLLFTCKLVQTSQVALTSLCFCARIMRNTE